MKTCPACQQPLPQDCDFCDIACVRRAAMMADVASRIAEIRAGWDDATELDRRAVKPHPVDYDRPKRYR